MCRQAQGACRQAQEAGYKHLAQIAVQNSQVLEGVCKQALEEVCKLEEAVRTQD